MPEIDRLSDQVLKNCDITDAQHAGLYSICGLALRLRDLYKWEKGLDPWVEKDSAAVLEWIGNREQRWEALAEKPLGRIEFFGKTYDPFDARGINTILEPLGYFYGGGYAGNLKPTFFLAAIDHRKKIGGYPVYLLGRELARDLLTLPALTQDNSIVVRRESARLFLWDQMFYVAKSGRKALNFALKHYGLASPGPEGLRRCLDAVLANEIETYMYHELGELRDRVFDREVWRKILAEFPRTPVELLARAVKDLLADTNERGTLWHIVGKRKAASLGFYVAFQGGMSKALFPELAAGFEGFAETCDWGRIEAAVNAGRSTARRHAESIAGIFEKGMRVNDKKWVEREVAARLLEPLGIS